jgi:ribosomal protein L33
MVNISKCKDYIGKDRVRTVVHTIPEGALFGLLRYLETGYTRHYNKRKRITKMEQNKYSNAQLQITISSISYGVRGFSIYGHK